MKWVTRENAKVDRVACPWLISRFIDQAAEFLFVPREQVLEVARREGAHSFDAEGAEFGHRDGKCTFETLINVFNLKDNALRSIAEIVHDIDLKDNKYGRKEVEGLSQIITGLSQKLKDDNKLVEKGLEIFDALYQNYSSS
mgnify:CR=1 FL=1